LNERTSVYVVSAIASHCPSHISSRIQECVRPVAEYAKLLNNNQENSRGSPAEIRNAFSLPKMGASIFNELCRLIAKFNVCVREYRTQCLRHVTISLIDSSYGYLCNEGYNTFMESAECLMELDRKSTVKQCHDETLLEIETANVETNIPMEVKLDRMCRALNFFSGCVKAPIKQECGLSAWRVIYRVLKDTTHTLMPGCQFTGSSTKLVPNDTIATTHIHTTTHLTTTTTTSMVVFKELSSTLSVPSNPHKGINRKIISEEPLQLNTGHRLVIGLIFLIVMLC
uniref:DUF19 domain-containing protein n=1 Tax=Angiostrongylus cantonensis TaxID=6313 RepID=A0A0K0DBX3_ANGCA